MALYPNPKKGRDTMACKSKPTKKKATKKSSGKKPC